MADHRHPGGDSATCPACHPPDVTPKTESGRALMNDLRRLPPGWGHHRAILAIEQEAASVAVAEVLDRLDDLVKLHRVLAVDQVRALIASERKP